MATIDTYNAKNDVINSSAWWKVTSNDPNDILGSLIAWREITESRRLSINATFQHLQTVAQNYKDFLIQQTSKEGEANWVRELSHANKLDPFMRWNVINPIVETYVSKIGKQKVKPFFVTEAGKWEDKKKAAALTQAIVGHYIQHKPDSVWSLGQECFEHAVIFGCGIMLHKIEKNCVTHEVIHPSDVLIDENEMVNRSSPQSFGYTYVRNIDILAKLYPESKKELYQEALANEETQTLVCNEFWRTDEDGFGRHVVFTRGNILLDEKYSEDYLPISVVRIKPRSKSFWGDSLITPILGIQEAIDKLLSLSIETTELNVPRITADADSLTKGTINDSTMSIIFTKLGSRTPNILQGQGTISDPMALVNACWEKAFIISGINQLTSSGQKPPELESRAALQEYNEIASERFAMVSQAYENFFIDIAHKTLKLMAKVNKANTKLKLFGENKFREDDWVNVALDEQAFVIRCFPANLLPDTPSGRIDRVYQLINLGVVTPANAAMLLDAPDTKSVTNLEVAMINIANKLIDQMLYDNKQVAVDPLLNLEICARYGLMRYCEALEFEAPEKALDNLRNWLKEIDAIMLDRMQQQQQEIAAQQQQQMLMQQQQQQGQAQPQNVQPTQTEMM